MTDYKHEQITPAYMTIPKLAEYSGLPARCIRDIDWQLKRIDNFADKLKYCYNYTGEVVRDRFGMSVYSFGNGVPFFAKMLIDDTDTYIAEYENGKFEPAPAVPTAMERLTQLKKDCPEKAEDIKKFIADNEYSLGSELFASRLDEFINSVKEATKEDN